MVFAQYLRVYHTHIDNEGIQFRIGVGEVETEYEGDPLDLWEMYSERKEDVLGAECGVLDGKEGREWLWLWLWKWLSAESKGK